MTTPSSIATRRESRTVKRPKKDLDDESVQHGGGGGKWRKEALTESLKYCGVILRELFSKKHAVRHRELHVQSLYLAQKPCVTNGNSM